MAQWKETLEPYVKVVETVRSSTLNPSAGGELIIGCALISDAGPSVPTLITSQSEFLSTYSSTDISADYIGKLDELYKDGKDSVASTMWMNAYRLAGSNTLLCVRASKASDIFYVKPFGASDGSYISRDGALMKRMSSPLYFKIDTVGDATSTAQNGWFININGVGVFGNYIGDEGAAYDYYVDNVVDLIDKLNETSMFFAAEYHFYKEVKADTEAGVTNTTYTEVFLGIDSSLEDKKAVSYVEFTELYLGDTLVDDITPVAAGVAGDLKGLGNCMFYSDTKFSEVVDINGTAWSDFEADPYYAVNSFNSASELRVRIRRFNHDAVIQKSIDASSLTEGGNSPWIVLTDVLKTWEGKEADTLAKTVEPRDFYEIAVMDPSISSEVLFFNIGNLMARGDMELSEVNDNLKMIQLVLPDNLKDLNLPYYTGDKDKIKTEEYYVDLQIKSAETSIIKVSDSDLKKALDQIALDEVYVTEGLCDLGNTELSFQNYMANMAINENYFYPISTVNSTNYMTIANNASKISQDSSKLYLSAPWDIDSGTFGWKTYMSPSVLYWEAVARNRRNNEEFRGILGQSGGIVQYQKPLVEFNKKTRQLLLSKRINTVLWNTQTSAWNMNDNFTKQSVENIMSDEGNSRLAIRISKAMPVILRQFIGRKIGAKLWSDAKSVIEYWFKSTILPMQYSVAEYVVIIDENNNPIELQKQNKMAVTVNVRYANSLKYITVYHNILEIGMDISAI